MGQETEPEAVWTEMMQKMIAIAKANGVSRFRVDDVEVEFWPEKPAPVQPRPETPKERKAREELAARSKQANRYRASGSVLAEVEGNDNG